MSETPWSKVRFLKDYKKYKCGQTADIYDKTELYNLFDKKIAERVKPEDPSGPTDEDLEILKDPQLFKRITLDEFDKKIVGEIESRQSLFLVMCGMLVKNHNTASFNLRIDSSSGAGKDYTATAVSEIFLKDNIIKRSRISPKIFNYWHSNEDWTWDGKVCYLTDLSQQVLDSEVFKVMASEGSHAVIVHEGKTQELEVKGKPVMIITTACVNAANEMLRRFPILSLDETKQQTKAIIQRQAQYAAKGKSQDYDSSIKKALIHLRREEIKIPYAEQLVEFFPEDHIVMRTHFNRLLDYIKASAALHQYQRERDSEGFLLAQPEDYDLARIAIIKTTSNRLMIPLSQKKKRFLAVIKEKFGSKWFKVSELEREINFLSTSQIYVYLQDLSENFFLQDIKEPDEDSRAKKPYKIFSLIFRDELNIPLWGEICEKIGINKSDENIGNIITNKINPINSDNSDNFSLFCEGNSHKRLIWETIKAEFSEPKPQGRVIELAKEKGLDPLLVGDVCEKMLSLGLLMRVKDGWLQYKPSGGAL